MDVGARMDGRYGASTGMVEKAPEAGKRKPSTLIGEAGGASNSMVPVWFTVALKRSDKTNELWAFGARVTVLEPSGAPVLSRMTTGMAAAVGERFATATPATRPLVLSNANI